MLFPSDQPNACSKVNLKPDAHSHCIPNFTLGERRRRKCALSRMCTSATYSLIQTRTSISLGWCGAREREDRQYWGESLILNVDSGLRSASQQSENPSAQRLLLPGKHANSWAAFHIACRWWCNGCARAQRVRRSEPVQYYIYLPAVKYWAGSIHSKLNFSSPTARAREIWANTTHPRSSSNTRIVTRSKDYCRRGALRFSPRPQNASECFHLFILRCW